MKLKFIFLPLFVLLITLSARAQYIPLSGTEIKLQLEKLNVLGSVLYFAAHPDDENTKLIAFLAQDRKYNTSYLSSTRGDGGQNLIGTEQGIELGLIRTQELLAARRIDKGAQYFTSAYDFGFSKTHAETFALWDKETVLKEAVYLIRKLRPDVIITRFPPDERGGHGHHQASAILAHEAYLAAADPDKYPEQLSTAIRPWKAKRLVWNTANFGGMNNTSDKQLKVDIGSYNPLLGSSYGEIAAKSRSQHKSQGFGSASSRGKSIEYFEHVAGEKASQDLFDGIVSTWERIPASANIQQLVTKLNTAFDPNKPQKSIHDLILLLEAVQQMEDNYWREQKSIAIQDLILACAGIWLDATTTKTTYTKGEPITVNLEVIARSPDVDVTLIAKNQSISLITNESWKGTEQLTWNSTTQPYWLIAPHTSGKFEVNDADFGFPENRVRPTIALDLTINNKKIRIEQPIRFRTVDPVRGEIHQPIAVTPDITLHTEQNFILSQNGSPQALEVTFENHHLTKKQYTIQILVPQGWKLDQPNLHLDFSDASQISKTLTVKPTSDHIPSDSDTLTFLNDGVAITTLRHINYEHIPDITWFPPTKIALKTLELINPIKKVGYIHGAGDLIPQSLTAIGIAVTLLDANQVTSANLAQFDAVVLGVRLFNVNTKSNKLRPELLNYMDQGGTVLVQYNVNSRLQSEQLGPYPFTLSRSRVTEENAVVSYDKNDRSYNYPNKLTDEDFAGWIQERGLYFAENIDKNYRTPVAMHDKDEKPHKGSLLITKYGKGKFVYTPLSFFRQLPAGVPGAYRLFVNLLTKE